MPKEKPDSKCFHILITILSLHFIHHIQIEKVTRLASSVRLLLGLLKGAYSNSKPKCS